MYQTKYDEAIETTKGTVGNNVKCNITENGKTFPIYTSEEEYNLNRLLYQLKDKYNMSEWAITNLMDAIEVYGGRRYEEGDEAATRNVTNNN